MSTSLETFNASIAISTTYIRLIIFWRGDTGLFLIAIVFLLSYGSNGVNGLYEPFGGHEKLWDLGHADLHSLNHAGIDLVELDDLFGHVACLLIDFIDGADLC